jgi:hypothetical protein
MRSFKMDEQGVHPVVATILLIAATVAAAGVIAVYVAGLWVPLPAVAMTVDPAGSVLDRDHAVTDNFINGRMLLDFTVVTDDIDDICEPGEELTVVIRNEVRAWTLVTDLRPPGLPGSLLGPGRYGGRVFKDNEVPLTVGGITDNVIWRLEAPVTTPGGEVGGGMRMVLSLERDNILLGGTFWTVGDHIFFDIVGRDDAFTGDVTLEGMPVDP